MPINSNYLWVITIFFFSVFSKYSAIETDAVYIWKSYLNTILDSHPFFIYRKCFFLFRLTFPGPCSLIAIVYV